MSYGGYGGGDRYGDSSSYRSRDGGSFGGGGIPPAVVDLWHQHINTPPTHPPPPPPGFFCSSRPGSKAQHEAIVAAPHRHAVGTAAGFGGGRDDINNMRLAKQDFSNLPEFEK